MSLIDELIQRSLDPIRILGFVGQGVFFCRFALQWIVSEYKKESVIPIGFWWCSLLGGSLTLVYAIQIKGPPVILGQMFGLVVYMRNLVLVYRKKREMNAMVADPADAAHGAGDSGS